MTKELKFYRREESIGGTWWMDSPEFIEEGGDPLQLQMVAGADDLLELLAEGEPKVRLQTSEQMRKGYNELKRVDEIPTTSGRYYYDEESELLIWLCDVTLWVFEGRFPEVIWYKKM